MVVLTMVPETSRSCFRDAIFPWQGDKTETEDKGETSCRRRRCPAGWDVLQGTGTFSSINKHIHLLRWTVSVDKVEAGVVTLQHELKTNINPKINTNENNNNNKNKPVYLQKQSVSHAVERYEGADNLKQKLYLNGSTCFNEFWKDKTCKQTYTPEVQYLENMLQKKYNTSWLIYLWDILFIMVQHFN